MQKKANSIMILDHLRLTVEAEEIIDPYQSYFIQDQALLIKRNHSFSNLKEIEDKCTSKKKTHVGKKSKTIILNKEKYSNLNESKALKSWKVMLNVMKAIKNLKNFNIQEINSVREIDNYLRWSKTTHFKEAFTSNNKIMLNTMMKNNTIDGKKPRKEIDNNINIRSINQPIEELRESPYAKDYPYENEEQVNLSQINLGNELAGEEPSYESMYNFKTKLNTLDNLINEYAKISECENIVSQGEDGMLDKFKKMIMNDPKRNIYSKSERERYFVNQKTPEGLTYIYEACLNGHIKYVELLLDCDADHLIKCGKKNEPSISILDAAVRWNHLKLVEYLVKTNPFKLDWPKEYIISALKIAEKMGNKNMISLLRKKKGTLGGGCCVACT